MPYGGKTEIQYIKRADGTMMEVGRATSGFWAWQLDAKRNRMREISIPKTVTTMDQARKAVERVGNPTVTSTGPPGDVFGKGFLTSMSATNRHQTLDRAVSRWGAKQTLAKLGNLQQSARVRRLYGSKLKDSTEYLQRKHDKRRPSRSRRNPGATIGDAVGGDTIAELKRRLLR